MPRLKIVTGKDAGKALEIDRELVIGRDVGNDVSLRDETCSRHHARVVLADGRAVLIDLGSNNGTFVNGEKVRERLLKDGDSIQVGRTEMTFEEGRDTLGPATVRIAELASGEVRIEQSVAADAPVPDAGEHLQRLYEIARLLNSTLRADEMLGAVAGELLEALDADLVAAVSEEDGEPVVRRRAGRIGSATLSRTVLERVRRGREALAVACVPQDEKLRDRESLVEERVNSVLCVPLVRGDRLVGVLYADSRRPARAFAAADLDLLRAVGHLAAPALDNAIRYSRARGRLSEIDSAANEGFKGVAADPKMAEVFGLARRVAGTDSTVLLLGESGTGKEVLARAIHAESPRRDGPFVAINCAAIVETLLESELFGYEKGAFTGAARARPGKFEAAGGGTLFLDEIGELSAGFQATLLRVLQERTYYRVGGTVPLRADVRVVAATNRNLQKAMKESGFREDLYYRLSVVTILLPPLRDRKDDIPLLAHHFLERVRRRTKKGIRSISGEALEALSRYPWPGNVRELENVIERATILTDGEVLDVAALPAEIRQPVAALPDSLPVNLEEAEKVCLRRALEMTGGKKGEAAKLLGVSWPTLNKKLRDYKLE